MCGIVGYIGPRPVVPLLLDGLKRLEYRGYDSAGVAVAGNGHGLVVRRTPGKLMNLEQSLDASPVVGTYGLGHTRWATHGQPSERNAHPHCDCKRRLAVVHNGIIENHCELRSRLAAAGHVFASDTDSEVVAHLIESYLDRDLVAAVRIAAGELQGSFALAIMALNDPEKIVAARLGAPVVVGLGENENFIASDVVPVLPYTRHILYLEDGEIAVLDRRGVLLTDFDGAPRLRTPSQVTWDAQRTEKNGFRHFMQKEIFEQPCAVRDTLEKRVRWEAGRVCLCELGPLTETLAEVDRIHVVACGTSLHAGLVGKWMIETLAGIPVEVDHASEYRYRNPLVARNTLGVLISQSGETADTIAAGREAREKGAMTLAISNVPESTLTREADGALITNAGPEVGVAATKTFTAQLTSLTLLALELAQRKNRLLPTAGRRLLEELARIPTRIEQILQKDADILALARRLYRARDFLFLGRGPHYPLALEGALKLKEISYIHAEGHPAGEMKHGPNALIDDELPVVFVATYEPGNAVSELRYQKTLSNMEEVKARRGIVVGLINEGDNEARERCDAAIELPPTIDLLLPLLSVAPLQLLAYHIATLRGCDVDQPRNLAKSVTVE